MPSSRALRQWKVLMKRPTSLGQTRATMPSCSDLQSSPRTRAAMAAELMAAPTLRRSPAAKLANAVPVWILARGFGSYITKGRSSSLSQGWMSALRAVSECREPRAGQMRQDPRHAWNSRKMQRNTSSLTDRVQ